MAVSAPTRWRQRLALWLLALLAALPALARASLVESAEFPSALLGRPFTYNVYLPTGYDPQGELRYPVLYLLHGHGGQRNDWVVQGRIQATADRLITAGDMPPAIIVMPDAGTTWYVDLREKMESAFFEELIPQIEKRYRAQGGRDGRVIAGLSMGGYGALRYALQQPQMFQAAAVLSPAIYDPEPPPNSGARTARVFTVPGGDGSFNPGLWKAFNYPMQWERYLRKGVQVPIYIVAGDDDEFFTEDEAAHLYALLRRQRHSGELRIVNGRHEWAVWQAGIGDALRYIFQNVRRPQAEPGR